MLKQRKSTYHVFIFGGLHRINLILIMEMFIFLSYKDDTNVLLNLISISKRLNNKFFEFNQSKITLKTFNFAANHILHH